MLELEGVPSLEDIETELRLRDLVRFIPAVSPHYMEPRHLTPLLRRFELAVEGIPQRVCCGAPPRFAKTESVLHVPAFALRRKPHLTLSYSTYADRLSRSKSRKARRICDGVGINTWGSVNEWRTHEGGGLIAGGVGGPLTGHGVDIAIVDDPVKNRAEAESPVKRATQLDWMNDVLKTRIEPGGSIFVFMTRWHPDDLIGSLLEEGFEWLSLPALGRDVDGRRVADTDGESLWPERWPTDELRKRMVEVGDYTSESLFQQQPRPRGSTVFNGVITHTVLPGRFRTAGGTDSAYSSKKTADRSAVVVMHAHEGRFYISKAKAMRVPAPAFKAYCRAIHVRNLAMTWRWYAAGVELGAGAFMADGDDGIPLDCRIATSDKFVRAIPFAAAWNAGLVSVDANMEGLDEFLAEMASFTGVNDKRDDLVDAAVAAYDELVSGGSGGGPITAAPRVQSNPMEGM